MIDSILAKVFGTKNEREIKAMLPTVAAIGELEPAMRALSDIDLAAKTIEFKERIAQGATLDDLLVEAFAVVREAGRRVLNMRHFDVQLIGGMVLHKGKIAEMKTGEGKTLVATLPTLPQRARRQRRPRGHGQRLPGETRLGMDGPALQIPGAARGRDRPRSLRRGAQRRLRRRHHLRHQQRVRLRLPARQHEVPHRRLRAARVQLTPSSTKWTPSSSTKRARR